MVMSREQNARQDHDVKIANEYFERVAQFKYFRTTLTSQNSSHEEIKNRSKSENALLLFGAESFVFQFAIQKHEFLYMQNCNFACFFFLRVWNLVAHIEGGTQAEGV